MARKTNTSVTSSTGKSYDYCRITPYVEKYNEETGEWYKSRKQFYGKTQKEAKAKLDKYNEEVEAKKAELADIKYQRVHLDRRPFGSYMEKYIDTVFIPDPTVKPATKTRYINSYLNIFSDQSILKIPVGDVTGEDLQSVFSSSDAAPSSRTAALKLIKHFYKYCAAQHITHDITGRIVIPHPEQKIQDQSVEVFSDEDLRKFRDCVSQDHRLRLLVILAIYTGARIGELCALTWDDIDLKSGQLHINKSLTEVAPLKTDIDAAKAAGSDVPKATVEVMSTKTRFSVRTLDLQNIVIKEIKRHKIWQQEEMLKNGYRTDYLFTTKTGQLYYKSTLRTALKRLCIKINVQPKGWHCFRHTYGSKLASTGIPIQTVSKMMGHSDISVTAKYYINLSSEEKKKASEAINF